MEMAVGRQWACALGGNTASHNRLRMTRFGLQDTING
jgi:hypothetical protein